MSFGACDLCSHVYSIDSERRPPTTCRRCFQSLQVIPREEALARVRRSSGEGTEAGADTAVWEAAQTPSAKAGILIVENNAELRETLVSLLEDLGYPVAQAENGQEALLRLRSSPAPGLILLDLNMPVMNGWVFRAEQRQDRSLMAIPMVLMSRADDIQQQAVALNAAASLAKPIDLDELATLLAYYCP